MLIAITNLFSAGLAPQMAPGHALVQTLKALILVENAPEIALIARLDLMPFAMFAFMGASLTLKTNVKLAFLSVQYALT